MFCCTALDDHTRCGRLLLGTPLKKCYLPFSETHRIDRGVSVTYCSCLSGGREIKKYLDGRRCIFC